MVDVVGTPNSFRALSNSSNVMAPELLTLICLKIYLIYCSVSSESIPSISVLND